MEDQIRVGLSVVRLNLGKADNHKDPRLRLKGAKNISLSITCQDIANDCYEFRTRSEILRFGLTSRAAEGLVMYEEGRPRGLADLGLQ